MPVATGFDSYELVKSICQKAGRSELDAITMFNAIQNKDFNHAVFARKERSINAAMQLYQTARVDVWTFLDIYKVIQWQHMIHGIYESEAGVMGADIQFHSGLTDDDAILAEYLDSLPFSNASRQHVHHQLKKRNTSYDFISINITEQLADLLQDMPDSLDPKEGIGVYLHMFGDKDSMLPRFVFVKEHRLFFLAIGLYKEVRGLLIPEGSLGFTPVPSFGTLTRIDVRKLHGQNLSPIQLYHPATNNLLFPHGVYAGTIAGFHDIGHLTIYDTTEDQLKQCARFFHDVTEEMRQRITMRYTSALFPEFGLESEFQTAFDQLLQNLSHHSDSRLRVIPLNEIVDDMQATAERLDHLSGNLLEGLDYFITLATRPSASSEQRLLQYLSHNLSHRHFPNEVMPESSVLNYIFYKTLKQRQINADTHSACLPDKEINAHPVLGELYQWWLQFMDIDR